MITFLLSALLLGVLACAAGLFYDMYKRGNPSFRFHFAAQHCWWVVVENGRMRMYDERGEPISGEIYCEVRDECDDIPRAKCESVVNVATSKQEMMNAINQNK
jgi:hypothetical protein